MIKLLPKAAVAAIVLNTKGEVLSVTRRNTDIWCLPGGKVDPGETSIQALVRELAEETDLHFEESDFIPIYSEVVLGKDGNDFYCVTYAYLPTFILDTSSAGWSIEEGIKVNFIPVEKLLTGAFVEYNKQALQNFYKVKTL